MPNYGSRSLSSAGSSAVALSRVLLVTPHQLLRRVRLCWRSDQVERYQALFPATVLSSGRLLERRSLRTSTRERPAPVPTSGRRRRLRGVSSWRVSLWRDASSSRLLSFVDFSIIASPPSRQTSPRREGQCNPTLLFPSSECSRATDLMMWVIWSPTSRSVIPRILPAAATRGF